VSAQSVALSDEGWTPLVPVNEQRAKRGLPPLIEDAQLASLAKAISHTRAARNIRGHLRRWQAGDAKAEGVGWNGRKDLQGKFFRSCCLYERRWTHAGAAISTSRHGTFYTLLVR